MKSLLKKTLIAVCGVLSINANAVEGQYTKLDSYLEALAKNNKAMVSVALRQNGQLLYSKQVGYSDVESNHALNANSVFRVGSISKIYTAAAIMRLVELNKLSLSDSLAKFYPSVSNAKKINIEHLLKHRTGIFNFTDDAAYMNYMTESKSKQAMLDIIGAFASQFEPGERYEYSNSNYVLLSFIIEDVTGKPFSQAMDELVFTPLKLARTKMGGSIETKKGDVYSYRYAGQWHKAPETDMSIPLGAGAVVSTAEDTSMFLHQLFQGELVSKASLEKMKSLTDNYGLGLMQFPFHERKLLGHSGGIDGFITNAAYYEPEQVSMTVLSNGVNFNFNDILIAVLSSQFNKPFDLPDFSAVSVQLSKQEMAEFEGEYNSEHLPLDIKVFVQEGQLMAQASGQGAFPLAAFEGGEFRFEPAGITMEFNQDSSEFTLIQGGGRYLYKKK